MVRGKAMVKGKESSGPFGVLVIENQLRRKVIEPLGNIGVGNPLGLMGRKGY